MTAISRHLALPFGDQGDPGDPGSRGSGPVRRLLGDTRIEVTEMDPRLASPEQYLWPEELEQVSRAVLSRRQQFAAGRWLARQGLAQLGIEARALPSDAQRVPLWPPGIVGTISHTQRWCAAAVARSDEVGALGIDVEPTSPLDVALWPRICRPEERARLDGLDPERAGLLAKALFCAKESIYKALYPSVRAFLDFQGMHIELEQTTPERYRWHAVLQAEWGPWQPGRAFGNGELSIEPELIASAVALPPGLEGEPSAARASILSNRGQCG
jgi:4'-phosphopantetheinyl transferase EntD